MFTLFEPRQGHHYRIAFPLLDYAVVEGCYNPEVGYFRATTPEHTAFSVPSEVPEDRGQPMTYRVLPVIVWDLGTKAGATLNDQNLPIARACAWIVDSWLWQDVERRWLDFPPGHHDMALWCRTHLPMLYVDLSPTREAVLPKLAASQKPVPRAIHRFVERARAHWVDVDPHSFFQDLEVADLEAIFGIYTAVEAEWEAKRAAERAAQAPEERAEIERLFDNLLEDACRHDTVVPHKTFDDGSIDGKCLECGEEGFPIRDVGYEESEEFDVGGPKRRLERLLVDLKTEPRLARAVRQALAEAGQ